MTRDEENLLTAASFANTSVMWVLLDKKTDPSCADQEGNTPLHKLVSVDEADVDRITALTMLINAGADPLKTNKAGLRPLMVAKNSLMQGLLERIEEQHNAKIARAISKFYKKSTLCPKM